MRWKPRHLAGLTVAGLVFALAAPTMFAGHATDGVDAKVTDDNNNVDGGLANVTRLARTLRTARPTRPRFRSAHGRRPSRAPSATHRRRRERLQDGSPHDRCLAGLLPVVRRWHDLVRPPPFPTGFNTTVPGFPTDTSAAGTASPLKELDASGDPVVRFGPDGDLYVAGIGFNRNFDQADRPLDTVVYVARYEFTPGTAATASTPTSAGSPPLLHLAGRRSSSAGRSVSSRASPASSASSPTRSGSRSTAMPPRAAPARGTSM